MKTQRKGRGVALLPSTLALCGKSTQRYTPGAISPRQRVPVPIVQEAGWAPGPVWTGAENLSRAGI